MDHFAEDAAAEEVPKEVLVLKFVVHVVPSLVSGYLSYLAEDADLDVAASDVGLVHVT